MAHQRVRLHVVAAGAFTALLAGLASACDVDCRETRDPAVAAPDGRHSAQAVHRSCGGAAGAEEDLVYVLDADGERSLGLRVHHQVGPLAISWLAPDHLEITLSTIATVVETSSPARGVELSVLPGPGAGPPA